MSEAEQPKRTAELRSIEGGRSIAARDVGASFAVDADELSCIENMAGFVIIAWNDEGEFHVTHHFGNRNPFSPVMVPDLVRTAVASNVLGGAA